MLAKYVAGSDPEMVGKLGCLAISKHQHNLIFVPTNQNGISRGVGFVMHLIVPSTRSPSHCSYTGSGATPASPTAATPAPKKSATSQTAAKEPATDNSTTKNFLKIPIQQIGSLARGAVASMSNPEGGTFQWLATISGSGSLIASLTSSAGKNTKWVLGSAGVVLAGIGGVAYLNSRTQNYISVLYDRDNTGPTPPPAADQGSGMSIQSNSVALATQKKPEANTTTTTTTTGPALFCRCKHIAVFQVVDPHAYWNTSMLLDSLTGLPFVSESATQAGGSASSGGSGGGGL